MLLLLRSPSIQFNHTSSLVPEKAFILQQIQWHHVPFPICACVTPTETLDEQFLCFMMWLLSYTLDLPLFRPWNIKHFTPAQPLPIKETYCSKFIFQSAGGERSNFRRYSVMSDTKARRMNLCHLKCVGSKARAGIRITVTTKMKTRTSQSISAM